MAAFIIILLLFIIVVSVIRNGRHHQAAVARRTARRNAWQVQRASEASRLHTAYDRDHLRDRRKEIGFVASAREAHAELKGTN